MEITECNTRSPKSQQVHAFEKVDTRNFCPKFISLTNILYMRSCFYVACGFTYQCTSSWRYKVINFKVISRKTIKYTSERSEKQTVIYNRIIARNFRPIRSASLLSHATTCLRILFAFTFVRFCSCTSK